MFCAICTGPITGEPFLDGPYKLCKRCACEPVEFKERPPSRGLVSRQETLTPNALRIRANRDRLKAEGLCTNGRNHGPAEPGRTTCHACGERERVRARGRRVAS